MVQVCIDAGGNEHTAVAAIPGGLARAVAPPEPYTSESASISLMDTREELRSDLH